MASALLIAFSGWRRPPFSKTDPIEISDGWGWGRFLDDCWSDRIGDGAVRRCVWSRITSWVQNRKFVFSDHELGSKFLSTKKSRRIFLVGKPGYQLVDKVFFTQRKPSKMVGSLGYTELVYPTIDPNLMAHPRSSWCLWGLIGKPLRCGIFCHEKKNIYLDVPLEFRING